MGRVIDHVATSQGRKRSPKEEKAEQSRVLEMKVLGYRDADIAAELNMSVGTVHRRLTKALDETRPLRADEYREQMKQQYEVAERVSIIGMQEGDQAATANYLRALAGKAKLLGVDAPVQSEVHLVVETQQEKELAALLAQAQEAAAVREAELAEEEA
jgi:AraC-like DNA-binding protein